jgi:hypothetical protein
VADGKRIHLIQMEENEDRSRFMIVTRVLDRDSLQVSTLRTMYLAESLEIIVGLYLTNFCPDGVVRI